RSLDVETLPPDLLSSLQLEEEGVPETAVIEPVATDTVVTEAVEIQGIEAQSTPSDAPTPGLNHNTPLLPNPAPQP
ncbi:hypothetical protein RZS08_01555, partial [Arthrospira platensis SPKY1]|nr:hypothetical protein [Arthrospira platensis SPKY1]